MGAQEAHPAWIPQGPGMGWSLGAGEPGPRHPITAVSLKWSDAYFVDHAAVKAALMSAALPHLQMFRIQQRRIQGHRGELRLLFSDSVLS